MNRSHFSVFLLYIFGIIPLTLVDFLQKKQASQTPPSSASHRIGAPRFATKAKFPQRTFGFTVMTRKSHTVDEAVFCISAHFSAWRTYHDRAAGIDDVRDHVLHRRVEGSQVRIVRRALADPVHARAHEK